MSYGTGQRWQDGRRKWSRPQRIRLIERLVARDGDLCALCDRPLDHAADHRTDPSGTTIDHVVRCIDGGSDDDANLQLAHRQCNERRGKRDFHADERELVMRGVLDLGEAGA
jgi:5-methylcytosine-specific restriction endonuclease McrA